MKKIMMILFLFFILLEGSPFGRNWGVGGIFAWQSHFNVLKGISRNWALISDFSAFSGFNLVDVNLGVRISPLPDLPVIPHIIAMGGISFSDLSWPPEISENLSFTIRTGLEYFVLKHFSVGINARPVWIRYSWYFEEKRLDIVINNLYETGVALMFYF